MEQELAERLIAGAQRLSQKERLERIERKHAALAAGRRREMRKVPATDLHRHRYARRFHAITQHRRAGARERDVFLGRPQRKMRVGAWIEARKRRRLVRGL